MYKLYKPLITLIAKSISLMILLILLVIAVQGGLDYNAYKNYKLIRTNDFNVQKSNKGYSIGNKLFRIDFKKGVEIDYITHSELYLTYFYREILEDKAKRIYHKKSRQDAIENL